MIELSCWKFDPPEGFTRGEVLFAAHQLRVSRGDRAIAEVHLADAIEGLVAGSRKSLPATGGRRTLIGGKRPAVRRSA